MKRNDQYNSVQKRILKIIGEPKPTKEMFGKLDSAASSHFINKNCPGKTIEHVPMTVNCANTTKMNSVATKEIELNLPLTSKGKTATVLDDIDDNLISVKQLCEDNCTCTLQKTKAIVECGDTTLICDRNGAMWDIPIGNEKGDEISITHTKNSETGSAKYVNTVLDQQRLKQIIKLKTNNQLTKQVAYNAYQQKSIAQLMA